MYLSPHKIHKNNKAKNRLILLIIILNIILIKNKKNYLTKLSISLLEKYDINTPFRGPL